ncbi:MAG: creatininase family protein [Candidatus Bathyarchaeota archaeon]|nr:creatininase family protein [Candidatus Bathyarchaeota archaeon]
MKLAEVSWVDAQSILGGVDTVILPVGSTEQHGPHCPLGTDHMTAEAVANIVGDRTGLPVLPVVAVGVSSHHRQFPGTLWVRPSVFRDYVSDVILSASSHGPRKFIIVNGHGGNTASLKEVAEDLRSDEDIFTAIANAFPAKLDGHAGEDETSVMLHLRPELVKMGKAVDTKQNEALAGIRMKAQKVGPADFGWDTIDLSPTGVFGAAGKTIEATKATAPHGEEIVKAHVDELCAFAEELKAAKLEDLLPKPHK